ncbi:hypothetical protein BP6252_10079 [Coleophoma cylindrospora]|uniref:L domain-like protein n=1 Tax=Coleophoma cylindrospora TaxID=1849047 RepID=A0A3D8QY27_9HELO|nr:hypothetical protein BP6252_10079 [Coleophoma cylindrospora]
MDQEYRAPPRASGLPRPTSRLPIPQAGRPSPSLENLQSPLQQSRIGQGISNPRLRSSPSRDSLSAPSTRPRPVPAQSKLREPTSSSAQIRNPSPDTRSPSRQPLLRKASSSSVLRRPLQPTTGQQAQARQLANENDGAEDCVQGALGTVTEQNDNPEGPRKLSLSERTMETLQTIPSSPAVQRRKSSFYNTEQPARSPSRSSHSSSRPNSSHTDASMKVPSRSASSRPTSSSGSAEFSLSDLQLAKNTAKQPLLSSVSTPVKRPTAARTLKTPSSVRSIRAPEISSSKLPSPNTNYALRDASPSAPQTTTKTSIYKPGNHTVAPGRQLKPRSSVSGLFRKASMPSLNQVKDAELFTSSKKVSPTFSNSSSDDRSPGAFSTSSSKGTVISASDDQGATAPKASITLREQIAKAKAAKRAAASEPSSSSNLENEVPVIPTASFDFGLPQDPFNQKVDPNSIRNVLRKRINTARTDGRLNIAALGLKEMPEDVMSMYNLEAISAQDGSWAESVDLTRFVAADNEFEELGEDVFPDIDPRAAFDDDEMAKGNQFGGLETLDLHGNLLKSVPRGLRWLELLTTLNLSNNKLGNDCFTIISQIPSLRDLKVAGNGLSGALDDSISRLEHIEVLDLQRNALTSLPDSLAELVHLRVLNLAENQLSSLPFQALRDLPIVELVARKNKLSGVLVPQGIEKLSQLQILDVTNNFLTGLAHSELELPALHQLSCSCNRITNLPDMTSWSSLLTIAVEDNNISSLPEGFVTLPKIKNADFSGNDLKTLDDRIGAMEALVVFRVSGNPLREKKFTAMATEDLKRALQARIAPEEPVITDTGSVDEEFLTPQTTPTRPSSSDWPITAGTTLDRSGTRSTSLNPVIAAQIASSHTIKTLELHHNCLKEIPSSIAFFAATLTTLSLAHNELTSDTFLTEELELPALKELNLSANTFNSLQPLMQHLIAPQLERLDISFNRLTFLPVLRSHFPNLRTLLASNNTIRELSPEAVKGLYVLDCNSNELNSLNARIGLLGGPNGLQRLDVSGNRFRVPKYTILEKGTEATLAWLKDRIPVGEADMSDLD